MNYKKDHFSRFGTEWNFSNITVVCIISLVRLGILTPDYIDHNHTFYNHIPLQLL